MVVHWWVGLMLVAEGVNWHDGCMEACGGPSTQYQYHIYTVPVPRHKLALSSHQFDDV